MKVMLIFVAVLAVGCQQQPKQAARTATPGVLDVSSPSPATPSAYAPPVYPSPTYASPAARQSYTPVYTEQPAYAAAGAEPAVATPGGKYMVKKGDTLYRIAKEHYGDGKKWQQIAAANPGVSPTSLRIGQTLVMP